MPATSIDHCSIYNEILGTGPAGPYARRRDPVDMARGVAQQLAANFRLIVWDRAKIGRSEREKEIEQLLDEIPVHQTKLDAEQRL